MNTKLYIPVIDTDSANFDYKGNISNEEYDEMVYENFKKNDRKVDNFLNSEHFNEETVSEDRNNNDYVTIDNTEGYRLFPCDAIVNNSDNESIENEELLKYLDNGKMFIIIVDINPETIDFDAQSELRFWVADSERVLKDNSIDDKTKLKTLPKTHFGIEIDGKTYMMNGCKLFEKYVKKGHPYNFALLVEKISSK